MSAEGYAIFMRDTNGDPPLLLGHGSVMAASPDGKHMAIVRRHRQHTRVDHRADRGRRGAGARYRRPRRSVAQWIVDRGLVAGQPGESSSSLREERRWRRAVLQAPAGRKGNAPQPVTPPDFVVGIIGHVAAPDSKSLIVSTPGGPAVRFPIEGGDPEPVPGLLATDLPLRFHDERSSSLRPGRPCRPVPDRPRRHADR